MYITWSLVYAVWRLELTTQHTVFGTGKCLLRCFIYAKLRAGIDHRTSLTAQGVVGFLFRIK